MGHNITKTDRMMSTRVVPWHYFETADRVDIHADYVYDRNIVRTSSGTDWNPVKMKVGVLNPASAGRTPAGLTVETPNGAFWVPQDDRVAIVRPDNWDTLSIVSNEFTVISNDDMYDTIDEFVNYSSTVKIETAGTLGGGKQVWVLLKVDKDNAPDGDPSANYTYMLVINSFDGKSAFRVIYTNVRVVCENTLKMAEAGGRNSTYAFSHRGSISERVEEIKNAVAGARKESDAFARLGSAMTQIPVTEAAEKRFAKAFIPDPSYGASDRQIENVEARRATVLRFLASPTCEGIRGTSWGLFQAGVEFADYGSSRKIDGDASFRRLMVDTSKEKVVALRASLGVSGITDNERRRVLSLASV